MVGGRSPVFRIISGGIADEGTDKVTLRHLNKGGSCCLRGWPSMQKGTRCRRRLALARGPHGPGDSRAGVAQPGKKGAALRSGGACETGPGWPGPGLGLAEVGREGVALFTCV